MRRILVVLSLVALASCGSKTPTAPSYPSVAGTWTGTLTSSNFPTMTVQLDLRQTQDVLSGTWSSAAADWNGTIIGTVNTAGSISAGITISAPPETPGGPRCTAQSPFGGAVTTSLFSGAIAGFTGTCGNLPQGASIVTKR
jgi:hypothetical protein